MDGVSQDKDKGKVIMQTSRRTFLKVGAMAGMSALGAAALGGCSPEEDTDSVTGVATLEEITWDGAFDVIVVGYGMAGAATALSAADAGASVLLIDKAPEGHEGGNSRYCGQLFVSVNDYEGGLTYYKAMRGEFYCPDEVLEAYVGGMTEIKDILAAWGAEDIQDTTDLGLANLTVEHPQLEGSEALRTNLLNGVLGEGELWRFMKFNINSYDSIDCWYESPATALIQDPTSKLIAGVEIEHNGEKLNIAAKKGVVMTLGGYENNPLYTQQFTGYATVYPMGTEYNEGDGFPMMQAAGAKMWHLNAWEGTGGGLIHPLDRVRGGTTEPFFREGSTILVGADGRRYFAEDIELRHGYACIGGTWMLQQRPDDNFYIFDEKQRVLLENGEIDKPYSNWSDDLSAEIESGKIIKADTLDELASQFGIDSDNLAITIQLFAQSAETGLDVLGRAAENMTAFSEEGPYYGIQMWPRILNSQGGPERSARGEIVDTTNTPIPHLYSAGEFGGVTSHLYNGGGNMAECIIFGNISGTNAAAETEQFEIDDTNLTYVPGCGEVSIYDQTFDESELTEGQAVGIGEGVGGPVWVKVTTESGVMTDIEVVHESETVGVGSPGYDIIDAMIEGNTVEVDTVSGSTRTCDAVIDAVTEALSKL